MYNKDYYENGPVLGISLYENYRWIPELTLPAAHHIVMSLKININDRIMDFGCAKGYLVKALRLMGYDATGFDISDYALQHVPEDVVNHCMHVNMLNDWTGLEFDLCIAKDVLEHIPENELSLTLKTIRNCSKKIFVIVPLGNNGKYVIPSMEYDKTHVIREDLNWWSDILLKSGWNVQHAGYSFPGMKQKWIDLFPTGHGFFVAERNIEFVNK